MELGNKEIETLLLKIEQQAKLIEEYKQAFREELFNNNKLKEQLRESDKPKLLICMECQNKY